MDKDETSEMLLGDDFSRHAGSDMGGLGEVHGGFGIWQINDGGVILLDWSVGKGLCLMNMCFLTKKSQLITFRSCETETKINYILVNNKYRNIVKDAKVIPGEEIMSQLSLLLMDMVLKKRSGGKKNSEKEIKTVEVERVKVK